MSFHDLAAYVLEDTAEALTDEDLKALLWHYTPFPFGDFYSAYRALTVALYTDRW